MIVNAQEEVTKFLGIPVDGFKPEMINNGKAARVWKSRARLTPEGKATVTPENLLFLTPLKS